MSKYLLLFLLFAGSSFAWLAGWDYRTQINISNPGSALTDYQVQVNPNIYNNTGLVGSWHLSEGAGTRAADSSGSNNDGTLTGFEWNANSNWTQGNFGNGLKFDGSNDYIDVGNKASLNFDGNFTLYAWVKTTTAAGGGIINKFNNYDGRGYKFIISSGVLWFYLHNGGYICIFSSDKTVNDGQWHQAVVVREKGSLCKIYIDGVLNKTAADSGAAMSYGAYNFLIGAEYDSRSGYPPASNTEPFTGSLDEVLAYNRSLSAQEIFDLYNATKARLDYADLRFTAPYETNASYQLYELPINTNGSTTALVDYQVPISITDPAILAHINTASNASDIRIFESKQTAPYKAASLGYWVEKANSSQVKLWVKVPSIPANATKTIYLYYGNPSATYNNSLGGNNTFIQFLDFEGTTEGFSGGASVATQYNSGSRSLSLPLSDGLSAKTFALPTIPFSMIIWEYPTASTQNIENMIGIGTQTIDFSINTANGQWKYYDTAWHDVGAVSANTWTKLEFVITSSTTFDAYINNAKVLTSGAFYNFNLGNGYARIRDYSASQNLYVDGLLFRKHAFPEPAAISFGAEKSIPPGDEALLNFWLESDKSAWVKVPSIPAGGSVINMYYGSPSAAYNNGLGGNNTFIQYHGYASSQFFDPGIQAQPLVYEAKARVTSASYDIRWGFTSNNGLSSPRDSVNIEPYSADNNRYLIGYDGSSAVGGAGQYEPPAFTLNQWYDLKILLSPTHYDGYVDGNPISTGRDTTGLTDRMGVFMLQASGTSEQEWSFIRKYASPEPSVSSGSEQLADVALPSVSIQSPNASVTYSSLSVPLNFTATDASGISQCKYELNGVNTTLAGCANATMNASSGSNSLVVWAYDGTNWGFASLSFSVQLDNAPPSIAISSPESKVYSAAPVPVTFVVSDASAYSCVVRLNGTINYSSCANSSLDLGNGAYILNVTANDTFGNVNSSVVSFTVNLTVSVSNSTTTNAQGIGNVSLSGIPSGASRLTYSVGSSPYSKSFSISAGVSSVRIFARATLQGTPASGKTLTFQVS